MSKLFYYLALGSMLFALCLQFGVGRVIPETRHYVDGHDRYASSRLQNDRNQEVDRSSVDSSRRSTTIDEAEGS